MSFIAITGYLAAAREVVTIEIYGESSGSGTTNCQEVNKSISSGRIQDFPDGTATLEFGPNSCQKLHEDERNWTGEPPSDPPMTSITLR